MAADAGLVMKVGDVDRDPVVPNLRYEDGDYLAPGGPRVIPPEKVAVDL